MMTSSADESVALPRLLFKFFCVEEGVEAAEGRWAEGRGTEGRGAEGGVAEGGEAEDPTD